MKKILLVAISLVMLVSVLSVSINAEVRYSTSNPDDLNLGSLIFERYPEKFDSVANQDKLVNYAGGDESSLCLKNEAAPSYVFTAEKPGLYTFAVEYVARVGTTRGQDYSIDGGSRVYCELQLCDSNEEHVWWIFDAELEAGQHTLTLTSPTGFDDSSLKSCDLYYIKGYLTKETVIVVEEAAPAEAAAETPVEESPADIAPVATKAPQTFDITVLAALATGAAALAVIKKRK